jgi:hypothetical protein
MKTVYESVYENKIEPDRIADRSIAERIYAFVEKRELLILGIVLIAVAVSSLLHSHHKQFWFDEIFTIIVSTQPDLHHFAAAMPAEGNPPLNTFLTRLAIEAFGISQISVRLVPLLGFLTALGGVYIFVRREAGRVFGILAVLLVIFGPVWRYSYEARPYGLLLGMFMVALVGWQAATQIKDSNLDRSRVPALFCLALGILGCAFSHYIGLIEIGVPLLVGEAIRTYLRRRVDWAVLLTGFCCLPSVFVILPMMRRTRDIVIAKSTVLQSHSIQGVHDYFRFAAASWSLVMDDKIVTFVVVVAFVTWSPFVRRRSAAYISDNSVEGVRPYILWACVTASLLIPITWLGLFYGKGWYFCRYGIGAAVGIVLWFCLLLAKRRIRLPWLLAAVVVVVTASYLLDFERELRASTGSLAESELIKYHPSDLPVVVSDALYYPTVWWYASAAEKPHVVYLGDPGDASNDLVTAGLMAEKPYLNAPMLGFESFINRTSHFRLEVYVYDVDGPQVIRRRLESEGFVIKEIDSKNGTTLFDVTKREQSARP